MTTAGGPPGWDEFARQRRVMDQMLSQHARLRDRYRRRRLFLVLTTMALGLIGAGFAFATNDVKLSLLGVTAGRDKWLGGLSLVVLLLGVVDLATNWDEAAHAHHEATLRLARLKGQFRYVYARSSPGAAPPEELATSFAETMDLLPAIPDRAFNPLKAAHLRKVEVSKRISTAPGALSRLVTIQVVLNGMRRHRPERGEAPGASGPPSTGIR